MRRRDLNLFMIGCATGLLVPANIWGRSEKVETDPIIKTTQELHDALRGAAPGTSVRLAPGKTYKIKNLNVPEGVVLRSEGARFKLIGTSLRRSCRIRIGKSCRIDKLHVQMGKGLVCSRAVSVESGTFIGSVELDAATRQAHSNRKIDACLQIRGSDVSIGHVKATNWDRPVTVFKADRFRLGSADLRGIVRGIYVRASADVELNNLRIDGQSPNARTVAGHNGVLIEDSVSVILHEPIIEHAGEHGVRVGGSGIEGLRIIRPIIRSSGQCGIKISPRRGLAKNVTIDNPLISDCAATSRAGSNEDVIRIANTQGIFIRGGRGFADLKQRSGFVGVYLKDVSEVSLVGFVVEDTVSYGWQISGNAERVRMQGRIIRSGDVAVEASYAQFGKDCSIDVEVEGPNVLSRMPKSGIPSDFAFRQRESRPYKK